MVNYVQDLPPPGGYSAPKQFSAHLPRRGLSSVTMLGISAVVMAFGFYGVHVQRTRARITAAEDRNAKYCITPFLLAEDRLATHSKQTLVRNYTDSLIANDANKPAGKTPYFDSEELAKSFSS
ncbi:hypothetical protein H696_00301 [Fonticula alba]|uniref:NADH dehydrogenase [ubiquinone] 1 alpha subcomplex subunit 13 n=1 Tax=Fonticula alba TaxID=691883 RepID=A0A058ZFL8_FONAL|nr:hypothetical protein H696_00301 [Fonticula alba]KCV72723.1 hypothetical protein H696_00301 [Fonticula alba]|eukprot:XP_009492424.1 hypothetical protein H696_00301 [Fonticula alba]